MVRVPPPPEGWWPMRPAEVAKYEPQRQKPIRSTTKDTKDAQRARRMTEEDIGHAIIGAALKVHSAVGPGLAGERV